MFCLGAQRYGLVLSFDGANCGAAGQKRLPLRRDLWVYRSLGLDAYRLIHMKCGCNAWLASSVSPQFFLRKNRCISPINLKFYHRGLNISIFSRMYSVTLPVQKCVEKRRRPLL